MSEYEGQEAEGTENNVRNLGWVTNGQQSDLAALEDTEGDWRQYLLDRLDRDRSDWTQASTPSDLEQWLDEEMPRIVEDSLRKLRWVSQDQANYLEQMDNGRGYWHDWLPGELDDRWPEWIRSNPETLSSYLIDLLPFFALPPDDGAAGADAYIAANRVDVTQLDWLTDSQRSQLETLLVNDTRGNLLDWLPAELDGMWPEWRGSTPDVLVPWLDGWIPNIVANSTPPAPVEQESQQQEQEQEQEQDQQA